MRGNLLDPRNIALTHAITQNPLLQAVGSPTFVVYVHDKPQGDLFVCKSIVWRTLEASTGLKRSNIIKRNPDLGAFIEEHFVFADEDALIAAVQAIEVNPDNVDATVTIGRCPMDSCKGLHLMFLNYKVIYRMKTREFEVLNISFQSTSEIFSRIAERLTDLINVDTAVNLVQQAIEMGHPASHKIQFRDPPRRAARSNPFKAFVAALLDGMGHRPRF